ncbi:glycosyltransferase family 2 protein [Flavobacterium algicola]|uniref:glycosyltransferase family 2 protein n=1 Tax=Flavobacterium algicola TaxID=556529 RepID=UPI001EFC41E9|nr:glycosyltransferase family 2 protein [Flavobacterium algicola]MCG9793928.1 glycosyltransferase [Flavobacterium algicola]
MNQRVEVIRKPVISIITVCYNAVNIIEQTILNVIDQDFKSFEYIVVDGGSTDGTIDIIEKYQDNITVWLSERDKGIYDAMNKGLKIAKGEWCYFMNAGDYFYDLNLLTQFASRCKESKYPIIVGKVEVFNNDQTSSGYYPSFQDDIVNYNPRYLFNAHLCHQALFVKTESYRAVGGFDLDYKVFSDFNTIISIIEASGGLDKVDIIFSKYNLDGVSADYKNAMKLFVESELILKKHGDKSSQFIYYVRLMHMCLFYLKMSIRNYKR